MEKSRVILKNNGAWLKFFCSTMQHHAPKHIVVYNKTQCNPSNCTSTGFSGWFCLTSPAQQVFFSMHIQYVFLLEKREHLNKVFTRVHVQYKEPGLVWMHCCHSGDVQWKKRSSLVTPPIVIKFKEQLN